MQQINGVCSADVVALGLASPAPVTPGAAVESEYKSEGARSAACWLEEGACGTAAPCSALNLHPLHPA